MNGVFDHDDSGKFLTHVFQERVRKNPSYSLRSFSRTIGVSPSHLSRVLKGAKRLSPALASQVASRLNLSTGAEKYFCLLVQMENTKNENHRFEILKKVQANKRWPGKRTISTDIFEMIADWHHGAILTLIRTKDFQHDPQWIARRLGIKKSEVEAAIKRLISLKFLARADDGSLHLAAGTDFCTVQDIASSAIKENHRQQMALAQKAMYTQPIDIREYFNLTLAMNPGSMGKAKTLIRDFVAKFNAEMDVDGTDEVFQLNVQFFQKSQS